MKKTFLVMIRKRRLSLETMKKNTKWCFSCPLRDFKRESKKCFFFRLRVCNTMDIVYLYVCVSVYIFMLLKLLYINDGWKCNIYNMVYGYVDDEINSEFSFSLSSFYIIYYTKCCMYLLCIFNVSFMNVLEERVCAILIQSGSQEMEMMEIEKSEMNYFDLLFFLRKKQYYSAFETVSMLCSYS